MKIGVFTETYAPQINGVVTSIINLNRFFERKKHKPIIFTTGKNEDVENLNGTPLHRFKSFPFKPYPDYLVGMPHLRKAMKFAETYELEILHTHGAFSMGACAIYVKRTLGLPLVGTFHTMLPEYLHYMVGERKTAKRALQKPSWKFLRWYFNQCNVVVAPSKETAKELKSHDFERVEVVPNGVDIERFRPVKSDWAEKKGIKNNYLLSVGRVCKEKRFEIVLEIAKLEKKRQFVIAGRGPELERLKSKAPKNVFFPGFVPENEMASLYSGASAFLMTSKTDTQGLTVLESMACGTPVICVPERGPKELVLDGKSGFFASTPEEFSCKIGEIERKMKKEARKRAEKYSLEKCAGKMLSLYERLIE